MSDSQQDPPETRTDLGEVFLLKGSWRVSFAGRVLSAEWSERGPAAACLMLLRSGKGQTTTSGGVRWNPMK